MHIYRFIRALIENRRYQKILDKAYQDEELIAKLSTIFGVQFRRDWIGRLYAVINPAIKDGKFDQTQVFEYSSAGYDTTEHAKQWVVERMILIENFIRTNNLFDVLTYDVKSLDENGNYLLIILPITLPDVLNNIKGACWETFIFGGILTSSLIYFM